MQQSLRVSALEHLHVCALCGQVDAHRHYARLLRQRAFDTAHATGAGHAADGQLQAFIWHLVAGAADSCNQLHQAADRRFDARLFAGQVDTDAADVGYFSQCTLDPAGATGARHAVDRQVKGCEIGHATPSIGFRNSINLSTLVRSSAAFGVVLFCWQPLRTGATSGKNAAR